MKILLAVDGSECSDAAANAIIEQFAPERSEVQILHADEWPKGLPTSLAFAEGPAATEHILSLHEAKRREAADLVARAAQRLRAAGFSTTTAVREGDPQHAILECAAEWHPDLIVLGSHGRRGLDRLVLGSVSEAVSRRAACSVEVVRSPTVGV
ncbi:MAG: universal stress protein [Acidobacteriota bacterium]